MPLSQPAVFVVSLVLAVLGSSLAPFLWPLALAVGPVASRLSR